MARTSENNSAHFICFFELILTSVILVRNHVEHWTRSGREFWSFAPADWLCPIVSAL